MNEVVIAPPEPDQTLAEARAFWHETGKGLVRESIASLDAAARQVIGVAGILEGLYLHAVVLSDLRGSGSTAIYLLPVVLLLASLSAGLWVFFPDRYRLNLQSADACKLVYERVVRSKLRAVRLAALFLVLGVAAIALAIAIYLEG